MTSLRTSAWEATNGGVPQNICSAVEIQLAGKIIIATDFNWEFRTFSSISSRAGCVFGGPSWAVRSQ